jgi:hypothetical protein
MPNPEHLGIKDFEVKSSDCGFRFPARTSGNGSRRYTLSSSEEILSRVPTESLVIQFISKRENSPQGVWWLHMNKPSNCRCDLQAYYR